MKNVNRDFLVGYVASVHRENVSMMVEGNDLIPSKEARCPTMSKFQ
jgi:hypothetical protein